MAKKKTMTPMTYNGVTIQIDLDEKPIQLPNKDWVHAAKTVGNYTTKDLQKLIGMSIWAQPVIAVKTLGGNNQSNKSIGIVVKNKNW